MKTLTLILTVVALAGCARPNVGTPAPMPELGGQTPDLNPAHAVARIAVESRASSVESPDVVLPPPAANGFVLHFIFTQAVTNCYLESSQDLWHWQNRYDFTVETNTVNSTNTFAWDIKMDNLKPWEFYRAGGALIP